MNALTIAKLLPLFGFVAIGVWFIHPAVYPAFPRLEAQEAAAAALLLVFTFGGFDVVGVPAGESKDPRRDVPFAFLATVGVVIVLLLIQIVLMGTLPDIAAPATAILVTSGVAINWPAAPSHSWPAPCSSCSRARRPRQRSTLPSRSGPINPSIRLGGGYHLLERPGCVPVSL